SERDFFLTVINDWIPLIVAILYNFFKFQSTVTEPSKFKSIKPIHGPTPKDVVKIPFSIGFKSLTQTDFYLLVIQNSSDNFTITTYRNTLVFLIVVVVVII